MKVVSVASHRRQTSRSKGTNMKTGLILIASTLMAATAAHAQSFNCNYAKAPDEVLICQNKDLAQADEFDGRQVFQAASGAEGRAASAAEWDAGGLARSPYDLRSRLSVHR